MSPLLHAYITHRRAAIREKRNGCHLNAAAWMQTAVVYHNAYVLELMRGK